MIRRSVLKNRFRLIFETVTMKNLIFSSLFSVLFFTEACKKTDIVPPDACGNVSCPTGKICVIGNCIDLLAGNYHMDGSSQSWLMSDPTYHPTTYIDQTVAITRINDLTMSIYGYELTFEPLEGDTLNDYTFLWQPGSPTNFERLSFRKNFDNTALYTSRHGGLGGGPSVYLEGNKVP